MTVRLRLAWRRVEWLAAVGAASLVVAGAGCSGAPAASTGGPWTDAETVSPATLASELTTAGPGEKPVVVYTGPAFLFKLGRIPGAVAHGPASTPEGLSDLETWARTLPHASSVVIYCGCCPLRNCPNLRPSFEALRGMGFARLRVLILPTSFGADWADKGLPVER